MRNDTLLVVRGDEVGGLVAGQEPEIVEAVRRAYLAHSRGQSSLPHSTFLRFPDSERNRIIALPAYLGDGFGLAGVKWISSFPENVGRGMARASAVLVLNSSETGRPLALLESSLISAQRTAASAALAARTLVGDEAPEVVGLIGTGVINYEVARYLRVVLPSIRRLLVFDLDASRAASFAERAGRELEGVTAETAPDAESVLRGARVVSLATTAVRPWLADVSACAPGSVLLNVSLRDLSPEAILECDNVVDDADHVCRAETSVHLAEQRTGGREFIRCTLADLLEGSAPAKARPDAVSVFSPFGLGVLDLALGSLVFDLAVEKGVGIPVPSFFPDPAV
ncbi:MAG TPA: 2,3-diaminopropionate biosynthesis protein SbnB [Longimicrobiaceae bacterium]|nr:2,3-diaminopropionate biosynthesis protein SbnB [Longimicrobiaceae bacterium]